MFFESKIKDFFARVGLGLVAGMLFGWLLADGSFLFLKNTETVRRETQRVELVIPYGTAERLKEGALVGELLDDLVLVEGDILVVKNEDVVPHQLGPLFIPPSTGSVLELNTANKYSYECSFQPDRNIGLDVRPRLEADTRLEAILAIALPTGMMLAVYSYLIPTKKKEESS